MQGVHRAGSQRFRLLLGAHGMVVAKWGVIGERPSMTPVIRGRGHNCSPSVLLSPAVNNMLSFTSRRLQFNFSEVRPIRESRARSTTRSRQIHTNLNTGAWKRMSFTQRTGAIMSHAFMSTTGTILDCRLADAPLGS